MRRVHHPVHHATHHEAHHAAKRETHHAVHQASHHTTHQSTHHTTHQNNSSHKIEDQNKSRASVDANVGSQVNLQKSAYTDTIKNSPNETTTISVLGGSVSGSLMGGSATAQVASLDTNFHNSSDTVTVDNNISAGVVSASAGVSIGHGEVSAGASAGAYIAQDDASLNFSIGGVHVSIGGSAYIGAGFHADASFGSSGIHLSAGASDIGGLGGAVDITW